MNPASIAQVGEQPSPAFVFPSSHASLRSILPLPHVAAQACVVPDADRQTGSRVQVREQPDASPKNVPFGPLQPAGNALSLVPQSQASFASLTPFPQADFVQVLLPPAGPEHCAPGST